MNPYRNLHSVEFNSLEVELTPFSIYAFKINEADILAHTPTVTVKQKEEITEKRH